MPHHYQRSWRCPLAPAMGLHAANSCQQNTGAGESTVHTTQSPAVMQNEARKGLDLVVVVIVAPLVQLTMLRNKVSAIGNVFSIVSIVQTGQKASTICVAIVMKDNTGDLQTQFI